MKSKQANRNNCSWQIIPLCTKISNEKEQSKNSEFQWTKIINYVAVSVNGIIVTV